MLIPVLLLITVLMLLFGLFVILKNPKDIINRLYLGVVLAGSWWLSANILYAVVPDPSTSIFFSRQITPSSLITCMFFFFLCIYFPKKENYFFIKKPLVYILPALLISLFSYTDLNIKTDIVDGKVITEFGVLYTPYLASMLFYVLGGVAILVRKLRKYSGYQKEQIKYILYAIVLTTIPAIIIGAILPLLGYNQLTNYTPYFAVFFLGLTAYAIVKHRLFDVRLIVARSVAYLLLIFTLGSVYGFTVFGFVARFFPATGASKVQMAIYSFLAVFLAFTFQPLRRFFEKLTDKIFYRDKYDSQEVLSELGGIFISKINSFDLLDDSLKVIVQALKVEFGHFIVMDEGRVYKTARYGKKMEKAVSAEALGKLKGRLIIYDELPENNKHHETLREANVYAVLKLFTREGLIGYLLLGHKQNGSIYTQQDIDLLEILSQELAVAIQNAKSYEEIANFSETLKQEVREATAQLRETNQRLRKLDKAKDEFISMASHQLRTPLTTIKGYLSMLLEGDAGKIQSKQKEFVDMAFISSERMVHLISDMLNVSRISTGRLTIDKAPFDIVKVAKSEVEQLRRQADAHNVKLNLHLPKAEVPLLSLDEGKLRQVMMNFMDNAIYYTPNGQVDVYVDKVADMACFTVKDNGIGVSKEAQRQLFTKFFRAGNAQAVRPDGTGLGLYMAKQVVEAQGGKIIFSSTEGKGSTFGFEFPLKDNLA